VTSSTRIWSAIDQPTILRLKRSWTAARYNQPSHVRRYVISATHKRFGAAICQTLLDRVSATTEAARQEARRHSRRLHELTSQQQKLVQLYYKDSISEEVLQAEQTRIQAERTAAERLEIAADREVSDIDTALRDALALIDQGTTPYLTGNPTERRLINLVIYITLLISDPNAVQGTPNALYAALVPLARQLAQEAAQNGHKRPEQAKAKGSRRKTKPGPCSLGPGSQSWQMAEREGFEPSNEVTPVTRFPVAPVQPLRHLSG
jgi:hypothetical protein